MEQRIEHIFETTPARFWNTFLLDEAFRKAVYAHMNLKIARLELQHDGDGDALSVQRTIEIVPERNAPAFLQKLLAGASLVKEVGIYDAQKQEMTVSIELPVIGKRVEFGGRYTWEVLGENRFKRIWVGYCNARIPLLGKKLESYLLDEVQQTLDQVHGFISEWLAQHPAAN